MLILSLISLSLPLQVPTHKAELCFSYTSAQLVPVFSVFLSGFVEILMEALNHYAVKREPALAISSN